MLLLLALGAYLLSKMEYIATEANKLNSEPVKPEPTPAPTTEGYLVKVNTACLNIREKAGTDSDIVGQIKDRGVYTIVAEADGKGTKKWGKLKSGAGWIALDYTIKQTSGSVPVETKPAKKSVDEVAREVIRGNWGNGRDRREALEKAGYDYNEVQSRVNELM